MTVTVSLTLNGKPVSAEVEPRTLLVSMLRDRLALTGTHVGCDTSQCGACVVHVDGVSVKSCTMLAVQAEGAEVTTIEGLAKNGELHPMQAAFREHHALQCGFCTPGMIMSGVDLLRVNPSPSEPEIRRWLEGNFCRCTGYHNIVKAIKAGAAGGKGAKPAAATDTGIGASVRRKEDQRFITGNGHYLDDINRAGQCYAAFVRSPHAHAKFTIDTKAAAKLPGVVAIYTGADIAADKLGTLICGWTITQKNGEPHKAPPYPLLATDTVRHVGDAVAVVIAESQAQARDAAERVEVRYEEKPAVTSVRACLEPKAPQVHADAPGNLCFDWEIGDKAATDKAFAAAHHVTELELINNRVVPNAIEPRAALAEYDVGKGEITLYTTSQNPHIARLVMSAFIQLAPEHKLRVISPDLGGGFGSKIFIYPEETVTAWAARKVRRPIKWTAERSESFMTDRHGRDHYTKAALALDKDGKFLGMRVSTLANLGAYLSTFSSCVPTYLYGTLMQGQYTTGAIYCEVKGVFTHTTPVDAVRGAGRPEATYVVERLVERAAREMKMDPVEIRRKNFIPANAFPYQTQVALQYDSGNYEGSIDQALELIDYPGYPVRRDASKKNGKLRGIGFSAYIEACGIAPSAVVGSLGCGVGLYESAQVRFNPTGNVVVYTGSHSHGQGHETTFAQIVSDRLGVPFENVEVVHGDTAQIPFAMGTYGSRSLAVGGSAISKAIDKIIAKGKKIAAHTLEVAEQDLVFEKGNYSVKGTDKKMDIAAVAFAAYVPHNYPADLEPGLDEAAFYDPLNFTFPAGTHVCEVEVDPDTGAAEIVGWVAADDFGNVVNPMIVEGQVHGGIAHGVGQAMLEVCRYDEETGQLLTGSYLDYCMPRADTLPDLQVATQVTPCPHNPLGVKGCGEAGAIAAPAALINALADAIGGRDLSMPATPEAVWHAMRAAD